MVCFLSSPPPPPSNVTNVIFNAIRTVERRGVCRWLVRIKPVLLLFQLCCFFQTLPKCFMIPLEKLSLPCLSSPESSWIAWGDLRFVLKGLGCLEKRNRCGEWCFLYIVNVISWMRSALSWGRPALAVRKEGFLIDHLNQNQLRPY